MAKQKKVLQKSDIRFLSSDAIDPILMDFLKLKKLPKKMSMYEKVVLVCILLVHPNTNPAEMIMLMVKMHLKDLSPKRRKELDTIIKEIKSNGVLR